MKVPMCDWHALHVLPGRVHHSFSQQPMARNIVSGMTGNKMLESTRPDYRRMKKRANDDASAHSAETQSRLAHRKLLNCSTHTGLTK